MSPTTPLDSYTSTTAYGSFDPPVNMVGFMLAYGAGFIARAFAGNIKQLTSLIEMGISVPRIRVYPGAVAMRDLSRPGRIRTVKEASRELPEGYDPTDKKAAWDYRGRYRASEHGPDYLNKRLDPLRSAPR